MPRWTGTWLEGPGVTLGELRNPATYAGERLGLAREGSGSLATFSARLAAFTLDVLASALIAGLLNVFVSDPSPTQRQAAAFGVLAAEHVLLVALTGALEWLPVVFAPTFAYLIHSDHDTAIYAVAVGLAAVIRAVRSLPAMISAG